MGWSTKQLADLTGVTLRSIRHWHDRGLLPEPDRLSNGYKQYTAQHLVLALRIARLTSLDFSLDQVAAMLDSEELGRESLCTLRTELDSRISELTQLRFEVDALIDRGVSPDLSPEALLAMDVIGDDPSSRNVALLLARLLPKSDMAAFATAIQDAPEDFAVFNNELSRLDAEAPDEDITALANNGTAILTEFLTDRGDAIPDFDSGIDEKSGVDAMTALMSEHMNPAQLQVMTVIIERLGQRQI